MACLPVGATGLDLSDPATAVDTWVRLKGDTAGRVTYEWVTGTAYGLPDGADSRLLFQIESVTVRQTRRFAESSYEERNYACRLYKDPTSGKYIREFENPFTGKLITLEPRCTRGPSIRYSPEGTELLADWQFESTALDGPMTLELIEAGDRVILRRDAHSKFIVPGSGEERRELSIDSFELDAADLNDPAQTSLFPIYTWTSSAQWMSILEMGDTPGHMLWSINGRKFMTVDELPGKFRAALEAAVPGALEKSIEWDDQGPG